MTTHQAAHVAVLEALIERAHDDLAWAQGKCEADKVRTRIEALTAAIAARTGKGG